MIYTYEKFCEILDYIYFSNKDEKKYARWCNRNNIEYNYDTDY